MNKQIKWSLIGVPDQLGVVNSKGRVGTALGPDSFWKEWKRLNGRQQFNEFLYEYRCLKLQQNDIMLHHQQVTETVVEFFLESSPVIVVGGGHDHGFSHLRGIQIGLQKNSKMRLGCINIDAHLDVRSDQPKILSGSPFYMAIEQEVLKSENFIEFGIQSQCNSPELWDYVKEKKISVFPFETLRFGKAPKIFAKALANLSKKCDAMVLSVDLDAVAQAFAPGVSAPQAEGLTSSDLLACVELAGKNPKVCSMGIFELNPLHDIDQRTARLAATTLYRFLEARF